MRIVTVFGIIGRGWATHTSHELLYPSTYYNFRNVKNHDTSSYHLAAVALKNGLHTSVYGLPI